MAVGNRGTVGAVGEIREADHRLFGHPQHFGEDALGGQDGLERLRDDDVVEGLILETGQPAFDVHLQDVNPVIDAGKHLLRVDLDTITADATGFAQIAQQAAVAAAEVEHPLSGGNPVGDDGEVEALAFVFAELGEVHTVMFSR